MHVNSYDEQPRVNFACTFSNNNCTLMNLKSSKLITSALITRV